MTDHEIFHDEPRGLPQEFSGTEIFESCTHTALDHLFEAKNAAMSPLLNAPGIAMHFSDDAVLEVEMPVPPEGTIVNRTCRGKAEIQTFFEEIAEWMLSIVNVETTRTVSGRRASWTGKVIGVLAASREPAEMDATFQLEFDEHDHVVYQKARFTPPHPT